MTCPLAGRAVLALLLAPVLAVSLWIEVIAGTGTAWAFYQPGQANDALLALSIGGFLSAVCPDQVVLRHRRAGRVAPGTSAKPVR